MSTRLYLVNHWFLVFLLIFSLDVFAKSTCRKTFKRSGFSLTKNFIPKGLFKNDITFYIGTEGYIRKTKEYTNDNINGNMGKTFDYIDRQFNHSKWWKVFFKWMRFDGTISEFYSLRKTIMYFKPNHLDEIFLTQPPKSFYAIKEHYTKMPGLIRLAEERFNGQLDKAYFTALAVVGNNLVTNSGWKTFYGHVNQYYKWPSLVVYPDGTIKQTYLGTDGLHKFASKYMNGDILKAYKNTYAALPQNVFNRLGWHISDVL